MKKLYPILILLLVFSLAFSSVALATSVINPDPPEKPPEGPGGPDEPEYPECPEEPEINKKGNNGFGNGDQDAPGNSGDHNNAENAKGGRDYPGNSNNNGNNDE